jgi:hypothetical protein
MGSIGQLFVKKEKEKIGRQERTVNTDSTEKEGEEPSMMVHTCNPSYLAARGKFKASLGLLIH